MITNKVIQKGFYEHITNITKLMDTFGEHNSQILPLRKAVLVVNIVIEKFYQKPT